MKMNCRQLKWIAVGCGVLALAVGAWGQAAADQNQAPAPAEKVTASSIVSKCLALYYGATSISGKIDHTVEAMGKSQTISTVLFAEKPSKLYLLQTRTAPDPQTWLVTSDGDRFSYQEPAGVALSNNPNERLVEPVVDFKQRHQTISDIFQATSSSIGDVSDPLVMVIGWPGAQKALLKRWSTLTLKGQTDVSGKIQYTVGGTYSQKDITGEVGTYQMVIDQDGNLISYEIDHYYTAGTDSQKPILIRNVWTCGLTLNQPIDETHFKVKL